MQALDFKQNYFELFGLKPGFEIDTQHLLTEQKRLQAAIHPDRFVSASERDKRLSVQQASWVNEASTTLKHPVKRARYLLQLAGLELNDESQTTSDVTFLMEQIELREEMEACRCSADPLSSCERVSTKLESRAAQIAHEFVKSYEAGELEDARIASRKMQFIQRIQEQVSDLQYELEEAFI